MHCALNLSLIALIFLSNFQVFGQTTNNPNPASAPMTRQILGNPGSLGGSETGESALSPLASLGESLQESLQESAEGELLPLRSFYFELKPKIVRPGTKGQKSDENKTII